jgi:hypothetical protein
MPNDTNYKAKLFNDENKTPSQGMSQQRATKILSNIRKEMKWIGHTKQKGRLSML